MVPVADLPLAIWPKLIAPNPELTPKVTPVPIVIGPKVIAPLLVLRLVESVMVRAVFASPRIRLLAEFVVFTLPAISRADGAVAIRPAVKVAVVDPPLPKLAVPVLFNVVAPAMLASPSSRKA